MKQEIKKSVGFTLAEILTVIIIVGIIAAIAIPNHTIQMKRVHNQEADQALLAAFEAQKDYYRKNSVYATERNVLDLQFSNPNFPSPNFGSFSFYDGSTTITYTYGGLSASINPLASLQAQNGSYTLYISTQGKIICQASGTLCEKLGYNRIPAPPPSGC